MNRAFVFLMIAVALLGAVAGCSSPTTSSGDASTPSNRVTVVTDEGAVYTVNINDRVFFATNKYRITAESRATLETRAAWLKRYPKYSITIEEHCDERGSREYNMALGERRAQAVKNYLVNLGISANRIKTVSYGEERPTALGHNEDAWKQNRRAVAVLN